MDNCPRNIMIQGVSMFRKPPIRSYQQNFPPLAVPKQKLSYSAATREVAAPTCALNFRAAASREPVEHVVVPNPIEEVVLAFDYNQGMLRAARVIFRRHLQYCEDHGMTPLPLEWFDDDFEPDEVDTSSSSYCDDTEDDDASLE